MRKYFIEIGFCIFLLLGALLTGVVNAQQPVATPPDETIRIPTEEVHLTIRAEGPFPGVAPKLRADELTVFRERRSTDRDQHPCDTGAGVGSHRYRGRAQLCKNT